MVAEEKWDCPPHKEPNMRPVLNRVSRVLLVSLSPLLLVSPSPTHADIYQWEYINPSDPGQGKRQSAMLAPGGAGVDAVPGADLSNRNLTMAYLMGADLTGSVGTFANLTSADLSQTNLTDAYFHGAYLAGADLTDAEVPGQTSLDIGTLISRLSREAALRLPSSIRRQATRHRT
jgi:hypothetical protein